MRGRVLVWVSLGLNAALAATLFFSVRGRTRSGGAAAGMDRVSRTMSDTVVRTNTVVRRLNFVWNQIESGDYRVYIANLRSIGCPESTIRDIIVAEVNEIFARRRATEVVTAEQQWWRSEPDPDVMDAAAGKLRDLEAERRTLLADLLGPDWQSSSYPHPESPRGNDLDGPLLGSLPPRSKQAVREIERRSLERRETYLQSAAKQGRQPDPMELERLRQQTRAELAQALTPEQLEEYLLRYSQQAMTLRNDLRGLDASQDEFRTLFRLRDPIDQELQTLADGGDATTARHRQELEQKRDAMVKQVLGPEQFAEYKLNQDPVYRDSKALAQQLSVPDAKVMPFYDINHATELEQQRIRGDSSLTPEQRATALQEVQSSRTSALRKLFGDDLFERYQRNLVE